MRKVLVLFFFLCLFGCSKKTVLTANIFAYNTTISINLYEGKKENLEKVKDIFYRYYYLADYQHERDMVNVYTLNEKAYKEEIVIDDDFFMMIKKGFECYTLTNGYCNIAIGAASYKWHDMIDKKDNDLAVLQNMTNYININDIILNEEKLSVKFNNENLKIDLGSIAKGYALREAINYLKEKKIEKYLINAGTSSIGVGKTTKGGEYNIHIINPDKIDETFKSIKAMDKCVSTSGDYQDYFLYDGVKYHHILNKELELSHMYKSVTVIGDDAMKVDALSTALFSMEIEEAKKIIEKVGYSAIFYLADGSVMEL